MKKEMNDMKVQINKRLYNFFPFFFVFIFLFIIAMIVFWVYMLVDSVKREYKNPNDKILWVLIVVLAGLIGAIIYYFVVKREEDNKPKKGKKK